MNMALSGKIEAKLEASRLLCELSLRDDMHQHLIKSGCLRVLVEILLPSKICEWTPRHAIIALGNLAGNYLFSTSFLPLFLFYLRKYIHNNVYKTISFSRFKIDN
jgi:hypothetical protein